MDFEPPDIYAELPPLAARLGVEPITDSRPRAIVINTGSKSYDLIELINALLDRMDQATRS